MKEFANNFLTYLERREEKLLSWGFHNVKYSEADMLHALLHEAPRELRDQWEALQTQGATFRGFVSELRQNHLIYRLPDTMNMYRTRMGEGVRLLANLRQMFSPKDWATGPRLVSDLKIHLKDRMYPRRDLPAREVWETGLRRLCPTGFEQLIQECYEKLSRDASGNEYSFSGFQKRSFERIFSEYQSGNPSGSVICAGTGSGKTKAFYIPAFLRVALELVDYPAPYTKVIAIYPRNVLLADQLREAIAESKKLHEVLHHHGGRPITFGALLGRSPNENWFNAVTPGQKRPSWYWEERSNGFVIPYLVSPEDGRSELLWKNIDRKSGRTSLYRINESIPDVLDGILRITREQLMHNPPDILFLSLEMLNRELGNPQWRKTFGIMQGEKAPRLVLLDEVHTYEGIPGAQVAWVLRRWKYWVHSGGNAKPPHFVGLSATLREAPEHMGRISGISPHQVTELAPKPSVNPDGEEMAEGQEYNIALKGDPSSGTALLSTSIQAAMLLARLLTPRNQVISVPPPVIRADVLYLSKVFGFTDNLDSLNRWYSNMRDAERQHLARFRNIPVPIPDPPTLRRMREEGQLWELSNNIGYDLAQSLDVSRCSSQDPGANSNSDLILATSSLEVGFDDPQVGMILHHKSPASMSSFIQRKGRAGRIRGSRPWTAVILSDYGRDRWAFKTAERLFNPEIDRIYLPIANPYVLRVQMTLFLVDWLGQNIDKADSPFSYLSKIAIWGVARQAQAKAREYLEDFLHQGTEWKRFFQSALRMYFYARGGLSWKSEEDRAIATSELNAIFWDEPRPILTEGIPSLLRKLEVEWRQMGPGDRSEEDHNSGRPMPQLIPRATFEELDLSEARIELEPYRGHNKEDELLPVPQFLRETCPGRVSKRFSTLAVLTPPEPGYWQEYSTHLRPGQNILSVTQLFPEHISLKSEGIIQISSPSSAKLLHIPPDILESSSSEWQWKTIADVFNDNLADILPLKHSKPWNQVFSRVSAHLHTNGSWIQLRRFASSCRFDIRRRTGGSTQGILELQNANGTPEAVGFQVNTDGLRFDIDDSHLHSIPILTAEMVSQLRYEFFLDQIRTSDSLRDCLNSFQAEWMAQVSLAMLCATAIRNNLSLQAAQTLLSNGRPGAARKVLEIIFQIRGLDPDGCEQEPRLKKDILNLWQNPIITGEIERLESVLWMTPPGPGFDDWVRQRYLATLVQAIRVAVASISSQVNADDLIVDVTSINGKSSLLLTEKVSGGLGQIESVVREIKNDPRLFMDALEYAITNCPREAWAANLNAAVNYAFEEYRKGSGELTKAFSEVRSASNWSALEQAKKSFMMAMQDSGLSSQRDNISALIMKILRPGSSRGTDILTHLLNEAWRRHSIRLGLEIPLRTFAYLVSSYRPSQQRIIRLFKKTYNEAPTFSQLYAIIQQLLFDGCLDSCPDCLNNTNIYNDFGKPVRSISLQWLSLSTVEVPVTSQPNIWISKAREALRTDGRVCLVSQLSNKNHLVNNLTSLFFEEINVENYRESVFINRVDLVGGNIKVTLQVRNFFNAKS